MNSGNPFLDSMFENLSSIYRKDSGMLNSNLFVVLNASATVFQNIKDMVDQTKRNIYINTADSDTLENNFGFMIDFPKPPRLNTLTNGDEIYRSMLKSLYKVFQSGSTNASMEEALGVTISYLTTDTREGDAQREINYSRFTEYDNSVELTYNAVQSSGTSVVGPARPQDIIFNPQDLFVTKYDDFSKSISFTGTVNTGTNYQIIYNRDNTLLSGTNWINLTDPTEVNVNPLALKSGTVSTFNNVEFSYWWNIFNSDGEGVVIDEFKIDRRDSSLAWRLPQKTIQYTSPFTDQSITKTIDFYNLSGLAYNIEVVNDVNPDILFSDLPRNYYTDVSPNFTDYYIRYSQNNSGPNVALDKFEGALPKFLKRFKSIEFPSGDFGTLDFFEKGDNFDVNNLFGTGTKHIWLDVPNINQNYILSNEVAFERNYSLHEEVLFYENFESGRLGPFTTTYASGVMVTDLVGVPFKDKEDNLTLMAPAAGVPISVAAVLNENTVKNGNRVQVDFFDSLNSGTTTLIDIIRTGTSSSDYYKFRFGMDSDAQGFQNTLLGISGIAYPEPNLILSTEPFGFLETYFPSSGDTNVAVSIIPGYDLVDGNPNTVESGKSATATGTTPFNLGYITPNASSGTVQNADILKVQFTNDGTATGRQAQIEMSVREFLGTYTTGSPSTNIYTYASNTLKLYAESGNSFWNYEVSTYNHPQFTVPVVYGGITSIPYTTGLTTMTVIRNSGVVVNGISYPGSLGTHWGTKTLVPPGKVEKGANQSVTAANMNPNSSSGVRVLGALDGSVNFHHYVFGNLARQEDYEDNLNIAISNAASTGSLLPIPTPYFYQIFTDPIGENAQKNYFNQIPRSFSWRRLTVDFGTSHSETEVFIDQAKVLNIPNIGFSGNFLSPSGLILSSITDYPEREFSYFDNVTVSKYDKNATLPFYGVTQRLVDDWEGSALGESTILDNKFFEQEPQPNFQFNVLIKGLDESFIFIINDLIGRLKPAHTFATSIFQIEQELDTTSGVPNVSNTGTDWETGNINQNIKVESTGQEVNPANDLPGFITISGGLTP